MAHTGLGPEAVIIELYGDPKGEPINYTCANGLNISKGTLLRLHDPKTVSAGKLFSVAAHNEGLPFAGIAAEEKEASDGATTIGVWTKGIFDIKVSGANTTTTAGDYVFLSGGNLVTSEDERDADTAFSGASFVGRALESASAQETIAVKIGSLI